MQVGWQCILASANDEIASWATQGRELVRGQYVQACSPARQSHACLSGIGRELPAHEVVRLLGSIREPVSHVIAGTWQVIYHGASKLRLNASHVLRTGPPCLQTHTSW